MNFETIQSYLNKPITELLDNRHATEQAKDTLKRFECFNGLLKDKLELFKDCEKICMLELFKNLQFYEGVDRNYMLGFKDAFKTIQKYFDEYQASLEILTGKER